MKALDQLRERRIERIERQVADLSLVIDAYTFVPEDDDYVQRLRDERARLWLRRTAIIRKLPPQHQGDTSQ